MIFSFISIVLWSGLADNRQAPPVLETPSVHRDDLDLGQIDVLKAANVDRRRRLSGRLLSLAEGCAAARGTEAVPDRMRVEGVGRKAVLSAENGQGLPGNEGEEIALAAAMGAIALEGLLKVQFDLECDLAAMA